MAHFGGPFAFLDRFIASLFGSAIRNRQCIECSPITVLLQGKTLATCFSYVALSTCLTRSKVRRVFANDGEL